METKTMLTISKDMAKNKAGTTLASEKNIVKYVRSELQSLPLVGDLQLEVSNADIMDAVRTIGDNEERIISTLADAARGQQTPVEEDEEDDTDEPSLNLASIAISSKGNNDLDYALKVAATLQPDTAFGTAMSQFFVSQKVVQDTPINCYEALKSMFGADIMLALPRPGTWSPEADKLRKGTHVVATDNERPQFFAVTEIKNGKAVPTVTNAYHVMCDASPIGKPICDQLAQYEAASGGKGKAEADINLVAEYNKAPDDFLSQKAIYRDQRNKLRELFSDAIALQFQFEAFKSIKDTVWCAVTASRGPTPIMVGPRVKAQDGEMSRGIGTCYGVRQFLAFDVAKAVETGGTLEALLKTVARTGRTEPEQSLKIETAAAAFNVLLAFRQFTKANDFMTKMSKAFLSEKGEVLKTNVRVFGDVYLAMGQVWQSIAQAYDADVEADLAAKVKEEQERQAKLKEHRAELAKAMAEKHNANRQGETIIVRKSA